MDTGMIRASISYAAEVTVSIKELTERQRKAWEKFKVLYPKSVDLRTRAERVKYETDAALRWAHQCDEVLKARRTALDLKKNRRPRKHK